MIINKPYIQKTVEYCFSVFSINENKQSEKSLQAPQNDRAMHKVISDTWCNGNPKNGLEPSYGR